MSPSRAHVATMMLGKFPILFPFIIFLKERHNMSHQEQQLHVELEAMQISLEEWSNIFLCSGYRLFFSCVSTWRPRLQLLWCLGRRVGGLGGGISRAQHSASHQPRVGTGRHSRVVSG